MGEDKGRGLEKFKLAAAVTVGSERITHLEMRQIRAGDLRQLNLSVSGDGHVQLGVGQLLDVLGQIVSQDPAVVDQLSMEDLVALSTKLASTFRGLAG